MTIGDRIVFLREEREISQKELAHKLHITAATLSRYENNIYQPKLEFLHEMCTILNTSADFLLGLSEDYNGVTHSSNDFHITAPEYKLISYYRMLDTSDQVRVDERIQTLLDNNEHNKKRD